MANIKSAEKRIKVIENKTGFNKSKKTAIKTYINKFEAALENNDIEEAKAMLKIVEKKLSQAGASNTIHKKNASRKISRLTKKLNDAM